jgi:MFS family permease
LESPLEAGQDSSAVAKPKSDADTYGPDFTVRQAIKTSAFWLLLLGLTIRVSATNAVVIHIFPILEDKGYEAQQAALIVSAMFFISIPLRFGMGVAGDYMSPRKLLFVGMNGGALGLLSLYLLDGLPSLILFVIGFSLIEGVTSVNWLMVGNYFGRSRFASLMGFMSLFHNTGMMISPVFSGWIRDTTNSYDIVMLTFMPLYIVGSVAFLLAKRPVHPSIKGTASGQRSIKP